MFGPAPGRKLFLAMIAIGLSLIATPLSSSLPDHAPLFPNPIFSLACQFTHCHTEFLQYADFNDDGRPDLLSSGYPAVMLLGQGGGEFKVTQEFKNVGQARAVDVDADTRVDLVLADEKGVAIRFGVGDGNFGAPTPLGFDGYLGLVQDLDGNGTQDILGFEYGQPYLLRGKGHGLFAPPEPIDIGSSHYGSYAEAGDFDGDGDLDIALGEGGESDVHILESSDGRFIYHSSFQGAWLSLNGLAVADFNRDGRDDLAVVSSYWYAGDGACVFLSGPDSMSTVGGAPAPSGDGFLLGGTKECYRGSLNAFSIAAGDLNEDANPDLVVADHGLSNQYSAGDLMVMLGDGHGGFLTNEKVGAKIYSGGVAIGDANQDGKIDLAVTDGHTGDLALLFGSGDGRGFRQIVSRESYTSATVGDVNADGLSDIVTQDQILFAGSSEGFKSQPLNSRAVGHRAIGDLNHDGIVDLAGCVDGNLEVLLGNGNGTFREPRYTFDAGCYSNHASPPFLGDMNADGNPDVVMLFGVGLGRGDGTFSVKPWPVDGIMLASADFNGDSITDVVLWWQDYYTSYARLVMGGKLDLQPADQIIPLDEYGIWDITVGAAGDLNGDGKPDLIISNYSGLAVLFGKGDGAFGNPRSYYTQCYPDDMAIADFDGDGNLDVAQAGSSEPTCFSSGIHIMFGDGAGGVAAARRFFSGINVLISPGDLNGDGRIDLVSLGGYYYLGYPTSGLSLLLNQGKDDPDPKRRRLPQKVTFQLPPTP